LRLVDVTLEGGLLRIGADARLFSADHAAAQPWSRALHNHPENLDGILYPSRLDPSRKAVALFEDRAPKLVELNRQRWYAHGPQRQLLAEIVEHYQLEIIETEVIPPRKPISGTPAKPELLFDPSDLSNE
jgi:hypothetical protein